MELYKIRLEEDFCESDGWPDIFILFVVANNEEEALGVVKNKIGSDERFAEYTDVDIRKVHFVYTGKETKPFIFHDYHVGD